MIKWCRIPWGNKTLRVPAMKSQGRLWFHWQGETHVLDLETSARKGGASAGKAHPGVISAPMPGKVTRVSVAKNQSVTRGQALVVMEAMKMEYTLEADRDGKVSEVNVATGQQVGLGEVLVRVVEA